MAVYRPIMALGYAIIASVAAWCTLMSVLAWRAFADDKARARNGEDRIPELTLLALAALGGWPGARLAQVRLRHKTRKEPFRSQLATAGVWNGVFAAAVVGLVVLSPAAMQRSIHAAFQQAFAAIDSGGTEESQPPARSQLPRRFGPGSEAWVSR